MVRTATKQKAPQEDVVEFFNDVEQRTEEWHALRRGVPTASRFGTIMASGKDGDASKRRKKLLYQLAGEVLSGQTAKTFRNEDMDRGTEMEPRAVADFAAKTFDKLTPVGFVRRTIADPLGGPWVVGASPDMMVGEDGGLEIKTMAPDLLCELIDNGCRLPAQHRAQCQGTLWVTGWRFVVLKLFYDGFPTSPEFRIERDEAYIVELKRGVEIFEYDLRTLVKKVKAAPERVR
jgi:hypothetical protein